MFTRKIKVQERSMPTAEEFASWGAYELSFEELLEVNGGKQVKDDPRTDRNSDTCPHSSNAPGERSSGGSSSSGGPNKGEERSPTQGGGAPRTECSPPSKRDTSSGGSSGRSSSSGRESGGSSDSKPSNPGGANKGEERSPTQGGGAPRTECSPPSKRDSSGGGGSFDRGERDRDSDRDSDSSGGGGSGYRPSAQSQPVPKPSAQHGQGNGLSQKPNPAVPALPEEKKGLREKISGWFNGRKEDVVGMWDWGKRKLDSIGQGIVAGMNSQLRMFSELTGIRMVQNGKKDGAGEWRNGLAGQENIKSVSSDGTWGNNGDATFTARKGATLSGLQRLTGKDWRESNWDKTRDPRTLQVGETVDMGKRTVKPEDAITVSNTVEARKLYFGGNKSPVWLSDEIFRAVQSGTVTTYKINERIKTGATELAKGDWGEDLTDIENMWFVGKTNIDYKIYTGTDITIVDMSAFVRDGCWDIFGEEGDATGPKKEFPFGSPYPFIERSWSISFPNPEKINWR